MMSSDEARSVANVFRRLLEGEDGRGWTKLDDTMTHLGYLEDDQLVREAEVVFCHHTGKNPRCPRKHNIKDCFIPQLMEAVTSVLNLYREAPNLHLKNRYILECYLAIDQHKLIVTD